MRKKVKVWRRLKKWTREFFLGERLEWQRKKIRGKENIEDKPISEVCFCKLSLTKLFYFNIIILVWNFGFWDFGHFLVFGIFIWNFGRLKDIGDKQKKEEKFGIPNEWNMESQWTKKWKVWSWLFNHSFKKIQLGHLSDATIVENQVISRGIVRHLQGTLNFWILEEQGSKMFTPTRQEGAEVEKERVFQTLIVTIPTGTTLRLQNAEDMRD